MKSLFRLFYQVHIAPAFGALLLTQDFQSSEDYYGSTSQSGNAFDSILKSVTDLGSVALLEYGPQNNGQATSPTGSYSSPGVFGTAAPSSFGIMGAIVLGVLVLVGIWVWKKL